MNEHSTHRARRLVPALGVGLFLAIACGPSTPPAPQAPAHTIATSTESPSASPTATSGPSTVVAASTVNQPPSAPPGASASTTSSAGPAPVQELELLPDRVSNHYPIATAGNRVTVQRTERGWVLSLTAASSSGGTSWAGYCWDLAPVDGRAPFRTMHLIMADVEVPNEVEVKLERANNRIQERVMRLTKTGETTIELNAYPKVRPEIERFCLALPGRPGGPGHAKFMLQRVLLR